MGVEHSDVHHLDHCLLGSGLGPNLNRLRALVPAPYYIPNLINEFNDQGQI